MVFDVFEQTVRKDACSFSSEIGKFNIQNMYFIHSQYKYIVFWIYKTTNKRNYLKFCRYLRKVRYYPKKLKIIVILDNLKVHTSKETQKYLESVPQRFHFVFTPKHASWLNIIESLFSKMTRSLLRGMRVSSKEELSVRISQYFDDINTSPVIFKWKYKMDEMPGGIDA